MKQFVLGFLMMAALVWAQEVKIAGEWDYSMPGPNGEPVPALMKLEVDGTKLMGTFTFNGTRVLKIENGTVDGNKLKFTVKRDRPGGGGEMVYQMTGVVSGSEIKGSVQANMEGNSIDSEWSAKRK
jgi:hypothetical protein